MICDQPKIHALAIPDGEKRNSGLDLLRSIAISLVLASHFGGVTAYDATAGVPIFFATLGYFGVELFFVLSGFLIGNLLMEISDHVVTFRSWTIFVLRRFMRTMPAYFVCLVVLALVNPPAQSAMMFQFATFTQNFAWPLKEFWFAVTWSLTIEEWFYLFFSITFLSCARWAPRYAPGASLAIFLIVPLLLRFYSASDCLGMTRSERL